MLAFAVVLGVGYGGCIALNPASQRVIYSASTAWAASSGSCTPRPASAPWSAPGRRLRHRPTGTYRGHLRACFVLATADALALLPLRSAHG